MHVYIRLYTHVYMCLIYFSSILLLRTTFNLLSSVFISYFHIATCSSHTRRILVSLPIRIVTSFSLLSFCAFSNNTVFCCHTCSSLIQLISSLLLYGDLRSHELDLRRHLKLRDLNSSRRVHTLSSLSSHLISCLVRDHVV